MNRSTHLSVVLIVGVLLLAGCGSFFFGDPPTVAVGECTDLETSDEATEVNEIETIDCTLPHAWEAYAELTFDDGDFPGEDAVLAEVEEFCYERFEDFIGVPYEYSLYEISSLYPTKMTWGVLGDRSAICFVGGNDLGFEGSLRDIGE